MHRDIVFDAPPAGCTNLATTSKCGVQGLYLANKILSVQGHPEFNEGIMSHVLEARHVNGVFDTELYNDGLSRAAKPHDGELIGYTMAKFIMDARKANK
jgi:GMP synthase (glutamine-hydrolysing)